MKIDMNNIIESFQSAIAKVFEVWKSIEIDFGTQPVSFFSVLVFLMVVSVLWYALTGSDGDD